MQIVKLDAIDSTNAYLKSVMQAKEVDDYTVVVAEEQRSGKGQAGASWVSEKGKNLTFSVLKKFTRFYASNHFSLNMMVSLAIYKTLAKLQVPDLQIKWPNDILSGNRKICGILVETTLAGNQLKSAVIGVGLNVNQTNFPNLPNAASLKSLLGKSLDKDELLQLLLDDLEKELLQINDLDHELLQERYERKLFKKDVPATFGLHEGEVAKGTIQGVSDVGKLLVAFNEKEVREFDLKEIKLIY